MRTTFEVLEVHFPQPDDPEPCIVVYGHEPHGQLSLLTTVRINEPFPDWESIARRIMRAILTYCL